MSRSTSASGRTLPYIEWRHDGRRLLVPVLILAPTPSTDPSGAICSDVVSAFR